MSTDQERAAFEAWMARPEFNARSDSGKYESAHVDAMWSAWQAARASAKSEPAEPIPEGCTPADAAMLRRANHDLAVEKHGWVELVRELCPEGLDMACDECGGDERDCPTDCAYRKARTRLAAEDSPAFVQQAVEAKSEPAESAAYCCEAAWNEARLTAWKARDLRCDCDHNESCQRCYPPEFRPGGSWDQCKPSALAQHRSTPAEQTAPAESGAVRLPPLPKPMWLACDTEGADFDVTFVSTEGEAKDVIDPEGDPAELVVPLFDAKQMQAYARTALAEQARPIEPYPARKVGGTFEADGRVLAEFDNDGTPMVAFKFNALPMIHLYRKDQIAASPQLQDQRDSAAARDVLAERRRQIEQEGWTPEHDDEHDRGELADAAACYAWDGESPTPPLRWPWRDEWWKPKGRRSALVRAGALILAEIERLDRAAKQGRSHAERPDDPVEPDEDGHCKRCGLPFEDPRELEHECPPGFAVQEQEGKA